MIKKINAETKNKAKCLLEKLLCQAPSTNLVKYLNAKIKAMIAIRKGIIPRILILYLKQLTAYYVYVLVTHAP